MARLLKLWALGTAGALILGVCLILVIKARRDELVWDHWDEVKPGVLYRSGELHPTQLENAIRQYRIRTVVSFLAPGPDVATERDLTKRLKVNFVNLPMPGDGFGQGDQFKTALKIIDDPQNQPVLIHCARGTCRTGATVAYYRYMRDGWTLEDVASEMERQVYREKWLPAYVYQLVEKRPFYELVPATTIIDHNAPSLEPQIPPMRKIDAKKAAESALIGSQTEKASEEKSDGR